MVERQLCKLDVRGSSPLASTLGLVAQLVELTLDKRAVTGSSPVWPTLLQQTSGSSLAKNLFDNETTSLRRLTGLPVRFWSQIQNAPGSLTSASRKKERYRVRERHLSLPL